MYNDEIGRTARSILLQQKHIVNHMTFKAHELQREH